MDKAGLIRQNAEKIMDGGLVAASVYEEIRRRQIAPGTVKLVIFLIGDDAASEIYVRQKMKACEKLGFECEVKRFGFEQIETGRLIAMVEEANGDKSVTGIIVQLPLPAGIDVEAVIAAIDPNKDVDGITPYNLGLTLLGPEFGGVQPCTANGVMRMLDYYGVELEGAEVCVVGYGKIAGKPIATMVLNRHATVMICNRATADLKQFVQRADVVIVAAGSPNLIGAEMVKDGGVVVDVGINRLRDGSIVGDCNFERLVEKVKLISPVPGGVGKMTVAMLMLNLADLADKNRHAA